MIRPVRDEPRDASVSVVVPVLNGGPRLLQLLDAVHTQDISDVDVILIDSGSDDGAVEMAMKRWPRLRVFEIERASYDHGLVRSAGVLQATASLVALLSQDSVPLGAHYLSTLMAAFEDPSVAGAMARQIPRPGADPGVQGTLRRWTPPGDEIVVRRGEPTMGRARFDNVGSMVRRLVIDALPFPARAFGEDIAWGAAALRAGYGLAYVPTALVEHHHDAGLIETYRRHRVSHVQAAQEFRVHMVPNLAALPTAWLGGIAVDLGDGGPLWAVRGGARRAAALLGQWAGGRSA